MDPKCVQETKIVISSNMGNLSKNRGLSSTLLTWQMVHKMVPYKKPNNNTLLYINKNSNHPAQTIKKWPKTTKDRLCRHYSNTYIFYTSKVEYETALKNSWYKNVD